jgi:hypothetical protein
MTRAGVIDITRKDATGKEGLPEDDLNALKTKFSQDILEVPGSDSKRFTVPLVPPGTVVDIT